MVDAGNSCLKWAVDNGHELSHVEHAPISDLDLLGIWGTLPVPDAVWVSCVAPDRIRSAIQDYCAQTWNLDAQFIESKSQQLGVTSYYDDPTQLGSDRWAALIGAKAHHECPLAIIDCGTAVTADALNADGEFLGGVIMPGAELMMHSLQSRSQYINEIQSVRESVFGCSTGECVYTGAEYAVAGGLDRVLQEFAVELGKEMTVLITGGNRDRVMNLLKAPVKPVADLVLVGLACIARAAIKNSQRITT